MRPHRRHLKGWIRRQEGRLGVWAVVGVLLFVGLGIRNHHLPVLGASSARAEEKVSSPRVLVVAEESMPETLHPLAYTSLPERRTLELVFEGIYNTGKGGVLVPQLLRQGEGGRLLFQPARDGMGAEGTLKNAWFHNGDPVTAQSVYNAFRAYVAASRAPERPRVSSLYREVLAPGVLGAGPPDSSFFKVPFARPYADPRVLFTLKLMGGTRFQEQLPPEKWYQDAAFGRSPVGTGPFKSVSAPRTSDPIWKFEAFTRYHQERPALAGIQICTRPSRAELITDLLSRQVHVAVSLDRQQKNELGGSIQVRPYYIRNWWYIGFKQKNSPFSSREVRAAFARLIDRQRLASLLGSDVVVAGGTQGTTARGSRAPGVVQSGLLTEPAVKLLSGPFVPASPYYSNSVEHPPFEPIGARARLVKLPGFSDDRTTDPSRPLVRYKGNEWRLYLAYRQDLPQGKDLVVLLEHELARQGIQLISEQLDSEKWKLNVEDAGRKGTMGYDLVLGRWNMDSNDDIRPIFKKGEQNNFLRYENPRVEELFERFEATADPDQRVSCMQGVHAALAADQAMVFLWEAGQIAAFRPEVRNVDISDFSFYLNPHRWKLE